MTDAARVVVTGTGVISALGADRHQFWAALSEGRSGIRPIKSVDCTGLRFSNGAEVQDFDPAAHLEPKQADQMDRFAQFGFIAAREAVVDSGIEWTDDLREQTAIVTGSCLGGRVMEHAVISELHAGTRSRVPPLTIPRGMENCAASQISIAYGVVGPVYTVTTACSSSNHAIGQAFHLVRSGAVKAGIAGKRVAIHAGTPAHVGSPACGVTRHLPAVLQRSKGDGSRRGRCDADAGIAGRRSRAAHTFTRRSWDTAPRRMRTTSPIRKRMVQRERCAVRCATPASIRRR